MSSEPTKKRRGFAAMDPALQRELASKGGRQVHKLGLGHEFTSEEARVHGAKGGRRKQMRRLEAKTQHKL
jgi:general stress protein YciG